MQKLVKHIRDYLGLSQADFAQKFQFVQDFRVTGYPGSAINGISHNKVRLGYPITVADTWFCKDRSFLNFRRPLKD